jgi:hypothetical protein
MKLLALAVMIGWILGAKVYAQNVVFFKDWKNAEILRAQAEVFRLESIEKNNPLRFGPEEKEQLKTAKNNLQIAQELNAQDYFVLYLSPNFQNNAQAFALAVQNMDSQDVAQILLAYNKLIEENKKRNLVPTTNSRFGFGSTSI